MSKKESINTCQKHGVPFVYERYTDAPGGNNYGGFYYCPVCTAQEEKQARDEAVKKRFAVATRGIPPHYHNAELSQFDAKLIAPAIEWARNPRGHLFVTGGCGVGKTHLACAVQKQLNTDGRRGSLVFSADMFLELRKSFSKNSGAAEKDVLEKYAPENGWGITIFDDVGAQKDSDFTFQTWYNIMNRRSNNNCPTMITTNLSITDVHKELGDRTASRMLSGRYIELSGEDRRMKKHWTDKYS
jgi:DNA replication protein DnaC